MHGPTLVTIDIVLFILPTHILGIIVSKAPKTSLLESGNPTIVKDVAEPHVDPFITIKEVLDRVIIFPSIPSPFHSLCSQQDLSTSTTSIAWSDVADTKTIYPVPCQTFVI